MCKNAFIHSSCIAILGKMSARTHFRLWEYRKIDDALLQLALNFPIGDKKAANSDTITKTSDNNVMTDSDKEVIVNITCQLCKNCDKVFDNQQQLQMHDKECTPESTCSECGKRYSTVNNMLKHFQIKHGGHVKMEQCSSATSSQDDLQQINRQSRSKSTESLRTKRASSSHVGKGLRNNQRKSTGEILLPEGKKSSRTKNKTSSQQDTEVDKVKNMNNVDIEQRIKLTAKRAIAKCKSSIDTRPVCKTAQQNVISHNRSSDNPKRQQEKEIQSLKDKQRESSDKKGNNERSSRITSSTKMKIKREIKKRNVDSKLKSVERYSENSCKSVVLRSNSDMEKSCKQMEQGSLIDNKDQNTSLKDRPRSVNGNKHKGTTLTETQESLSYKTTHNKSEIGHGNSKQRLAKEQMQPKGQKFSCGLCTKSFTSRMGYKQHCKKMHKTIPDLDLKTNTSRIKISQIGTLTIPCSICGKSFSAQWQLNRHLLVHCKNMAFRCDHCSNVFKWPDSLRRHVLKVHPDKKSDTSRKMPKSCSTCGKTFRTKSKLSLHLSVHTNLKIRCKYCERIFKKPDSLQYHIANVHSDVSVQTIPHPSSEESSKKWTCTLCPSHFESWTKLTKHCLDSHNGVQCVNNGIQNKEMGVLELKQEEECSVNNSKFNNSFNRLGFEENLVFEKGREEYLKKPYACFLCNRRYNYEKGLLSHCKENHNGLGIEKDKNEPLACSVCNAKFKYRKAMKNHCIKFHEGSGLKHGDTLVEKTSMLRQNKSGNIKKVKTGTLFNRRVTLLKAMTNRSQNKLKNNEKKSKENLLRDDNYRRVKLNQRKDFASAPGSEIVTTTSCSSFTREQDKKQVDEQKNKQVTEKGNGSGRVDAIELKELKVLVKRCAPIPYSRDCQKNEQLTENINTRTQNDQNKKFNKQNEVVDQNGHGSVDLETKNNPLTDTQSPFTMCVQDKLHERLLIPLNSLNLSAKRSNNDFKNFKITVKHSSQRIVSAITQEPMENQTTTEIEEHLNDTQKKQALLTEETKVSRWSGIETHIMEPLGAQHSEVEPVKLLGKSCVSINSPKAQRLKHSKDNEKGGSLTCANSGKRSKISCESLAKRFERTNLHHEQRNISEVKGQGDQKLISGNTNQIELKSSNKNESSGNYYNSVEMQNNELKDNMETKCQSPKIFLNRLPPFLEVEKSVNVNDILLKGSIDKMAASPKSISNRNQNMFHNEMMLEKSWSSEDEDDVLARKVADLREIIRARRSKKYGGIKEMYQVNKDISIKNTSETDDIKTTHESQSGSKGLSIGSEKISIDGKCSTESNETSVDDDNEDHIDMSSNSSLYRSKEEDMTESTNIQMTDISSDHKETIKNLTLLHNVTVHDTTEENRKLVEKRHELTITDKPIGRTVKGKRRAVRNMNSNDQSKHVLKTLPSHGKQKKMPLASKKKRNLFSFSHKDPSLDTNQNVMDEVAQDGDSLQKVHEVTDEEINTSNRGSNTRKDTTTNEVLNTEIDFRQNELTTEEIEPGENKNVESKQNESLNLEIDHIPSGNEMDRIPTGNEMDPLLSGNEMDSIPTGNQMDHMPTDNQMDSIPTGNQMDHMPTDNQMDYIPTGNQMDHIPTGNQMDHMPTDNQMDPLTDNQMDPLPSGNQVDPMPSGNQVDPMSSGNQVDPMPSDNQVDPMSSGNQVDPMPSGNQVDPMGSGNQVDPMSSGNQVDPMSSGNQVDPMGSGNQVDPMGSGNQVDPMSSGNQVVDPMSSGNQVDPMGSGNQVDPMSSGNQVDPMSSGNQVDPMGSGNQVDPMSSGNQVVDPMSSGNQVDPMSSGNQVDPMGSGNQVDPMSSGNQVDPMGSGNQCLNTNLDKNELACPGKEGNSSFSCTTEMLSGFEKETHGDNSIESIDETVGSAEENNYKKMDIEKETFKVLKLNWNPYFSDKRLVPLDISEEEEQTKTEKINQFPKIIRYVNDSQAPEISNALSSVNALDDILPQMLKMLTQHENGLDLNRVFNDIVVENSNDCYEIDYGATDSTSDFLSLGHCFGKWTNPDIVCDLCGKIFHCNEKYVEHKCIEDRKCTDFSEVDMMPNSSFSHVIDDSVLDRDKDASQKFVCNICGLKYKSKKSLKRHCKNHHSVVKSPEVFKLKMKIQKLYKSFFSERTELLSSSETSGNISPLPEDQCMSDTVNDLEKVVRYVAEPISECDYPSSVDDVTCGSDSTLVNLSMQSSENVSSSLMHSINDDNSTLVSSPNHDISGNGRADIDITNCSTEADTTIVDSCLNESFDSQQNVHYNQSVSHSIRDGESHETNSVFELHIAKTPEKGLKTIQQHLVSTPIKQYMAKTPVQTLFDYAKENSPSRMLNSFNQDSAITDQVFTLEEINRKFKNILLECKVELENLQLEEEYLYIGDITLMKVGTCRWKVLSENQNLTLDSQTNGIDDMKVGTCRWKVLYENQNLTLDSKANGIDDMKVGTCRWKVLSENQNLTLDSKANGIDDKDSDTEFVIHKSQSEVNNRSNSQNIRPATNDFDVNCPTYEIEYFPSLEDNSSLDNAFQTINSSSDAQKLNKVKESQTNLLQSSPKKKLTEFEKAIITKPMEVRRKRKLERTVSTLDDSNSHDGLDFLKRANERDANNSKNENYFMLSKLAQSIIHKKAKQNEQENLNFAPCGIEDIEPFETVLASRDKVKKSPLKKKQTTKLNDSEKSTRTVLSNTLDSCLSNNSNQNTSADVGDVTLTNSGEINEMFQDDITVETPRKIVLSNGSVLRKTSETFDMTSSLGRYDNVPLKTIGKQKSLSERFGAIEKPSNSGDDSSNLTKSFKSLRSEEVLKSMFGTGAAKFDKKFRKQPGEESKQDTLMSLKSPLQSVERIVTVKYGSRPIPDLKQTVVATERKQPGNTKRHLLNMLKELMDSPDGKSISPNVSLSSPKDTGIFSDTQYVRTIIDTQKDKSYESINFIKNSINSPTNKKQHLNITKFGVIGEPTIESERIECTTAKSVQMSTLTGKSDFSVSVEQNNEKTTLLSTAKTGEKPDLPHDNSSDISCKDSLWECSNSSQHSTDISTSWRKRSGSEAEGQPRKKKRIERMPVDDDKSTNGNNLLSNVETQSKTVISLSNVETQSKPVTNATQTVPSSYITKTTDTHPDGGKTTDKSMQSDRTISIIEHESRVERKEESQNLTELAVDMETQEEIVENFSTVDDTFEFDVDDHGQENKNLISELEPETKVKQNNVFDESSRNINGREDSYDAENVNKHPEWDANLSPVSSADFEQLENDTENIEDNSNKGNSDYDVGSDNSGNEKCDESDNENSDNEEEKENIASGKDDDSDESKSEEDTAYSRENSDEEGNDTDDESKDEIKEEEDIFSSTQFLPTKDFYHDDDAISILVDEFETASFLIAPEGDEKERMKSLDEELGELNTENNMNCDMDICSISPDTASNTQDVSSTDMDVQQQLANYHGPYPPGYCFSYLRQGKCVNKNRCLYRHQMPTQVELYRSCVKGIAEAYNKGEANRAFEIYNSLLETKVALTPCDTLTQLLKVAENNWNVKSAFRILDDLNQQNMVTAEVCETLIRLCGPRPEYYWQYLWKLFEIIFKSQRIKLTPDSISVLLRSFSDIEDLAYLWNVIVYAKKCKMRTVPADMLYDVLAKSLANSDQYYQYLVMWVQLCESNLLQQMNKELRANLKQLFHNRRQIDCEKKLEESVTCNLQQKFDDSNGATSSTQQQSVVVLKDCIKTTDKYKAFHHKIQSCYHTKNWAFLGETFVELCMQGELDNSYYIDPYAKVFLTNIKNSAVLVEAFNMFMISVSKQYLEESQEDVLAQFDARSLSYIGNRLLYACQDEKWWLEGHDIVKIMIRYDVPFYRYSEIGKQMSCITAINICLHANDVPTAYNIHLHFGWETQVKMSLPELKFEVVILHDLFDQLLKTKPREALKVLGSCLDIIDNNPELNEHFDFIEDFNNLILTALDCGDFYVGCWAFKLHSTAQVSQDLNRRILRALLTACGENGYIIEAKELYKICKAKSSYPLQNIQSPRTIRLSTIMTYIEIKLEVESYLEWVYSSLCEFQMEGNLLENSHFLTRVYIERITDPVAYEMPYLCRVPRTETAAYNMVTKLFLDEFGMEGKIICEKTSFIYLKMEHIRNYLEILDSKGLRQGFRVRGFNRK